MRFTWDRDKNARNVYEREIDFHDATSVFHDPLAQSREDRDSPPGELRFQTVGYGISRVLFIVHTEREGDVIRIISARRAKPSEVRQYEEGSFGD